MLTLIGNKSDACLLVDLHIFDEDFDFDCVRRKIYFSFLSCWLIIYHVSVIGLLICLLGLNSL